MATYVLLITFKKTQPLTIGARGIHTLEQGSYLYVGSARLAWEKRVARHCRSEKKKRWHIDYILAANGAMVTAVWVSQENMECTICGVLLAQKWITVPMAKIGASDCRCPAHFLAVDNGFAATRKILQKNGFAPLSKLP